MRVGLFGGSFNPIHFGHLRAAEEVREALGFDLVYFVPAASPPHKPQGELAPSEHRLQMARLGIKGNRHFMVSDAEIKRVGHSYAIDTARFFLSTLRSPSTLFLMMGTDQFAELETWKECDELTAICSLAVHARLAPGEFGRPKISVAVINRFGYAKADDHYVHPRGQTLSFIETTDLPVSASFIRKKIAKGESIRYLLPADVADYIRHHSLY